MSFIIKLSHILLREKWGEAGNFLASFTLIYLKLPMCQSSVSFPELNLDEGLVLFPSGTHFRPHEPMSCPILLWFMSTLLSIFILPIFKFCLTSDLSRTKEPEIVKEMDFHWRMFKLNSHRDIFGQGTVVK